MIAIEAQGIEQKFQAGAACFIWQDFRVGQPGVIVDGQIQIFPALAALLAAARRALPGAIAGDAMSDPFDAAELLDVDVDHLAEQGLLIADDLNFRIEVGEAAQPLGVADAGHGRARQPGLAGDGLPQQCSRGR